MTSTLTGRRLLLVEDEYFLAADLAQPFWADCIEVIEPAASVDDALDLLHDTDQFDGPCSTLIVRVR